MKRAIIYLRVSTDEQRNNNSFSMQETDCRAYAERHDLSVFDVISDDISGAKLDRPGLNRVRELAENHQIDALVIWTADRLARKHAYIGLLEEEFLQAGVEVHYADVGKVDDDDPEMQLTGGMKGVFAEYERNRIRKRLTRGRREKIEKKQRISGHGADAPFGYRYEGKKAERQMLIVEAEAQIVRDIYEWYTDGMNVIHIQDKLNALRVPPPLTGRCVKARELADARAQQALARGEEPKRGQGMTPIRPRPDGGWSRTTLYKILKLETYAGVFYHFKKHNGRRTAREQWIGVPVPAIISRETFDAAQERLANGRALSQRQNIRECLLRCRLRCECGYTCNVHSGSTRVVKGYYECQSRRERGRKCEHVYTRVDAVDATVWHWIETVALDEEKLRAALCERQTTVQDERTKLDGQRVRLYEQRARVEAEMSKLIQLYTSGIFTLEQVAKEKGALDTSLATLNEDIANVDAYIGGLGLSEGEFNDLIAFAQQVKQKLADSRFERRRRIVELLRVKVTLVTREGVRCAAIEAHMTLQSGFVELQRNGDEDEHGIVSILQTACTARCSPGSPKTRCFSTAAARW